MTGTAVKLRLSAALAGALLLGACDENGEFAFPGASDDGAAADAPARAAIQTVSGERDVERPDVFDVTDRGLWDGRPSLGGVWVAHPDASDPERVIIRNPANGQSVVGALFRRERENPGPLLQVSSDAAEALDILAGAPTELSVIALRREEVEVEATPEVNPVVAGLEAPVSVSAEPLEPAAPSAAADAEDAQDDDAGPVAVVLPPVTAAAAEVADTTAAAAASVAAIATQSAEAATESGEAASDTVDVSAVLATPVEPNPLPSGTVAQVGVYSVEANAGAAASQIINAGLPANVFAEEIGGRTVWRVLAGPLADDGAIAQLKGMGFVDAFIVEQDDAADQ